MICCYWTYRCFLNNLLWVLICLNVSAARELLKAGSFYACVCEYTYCSHHASWHLITGFFVLVWSVGPDFFFSLWNRHQKFVGCNVISPNCSPLCYYRGKCPIMRRDSLCFCPAKAIWIDSIMQNKLQRKRINSPKPLCSHEKWEHLLTLWLTSNDSRFVVFLLNHVALMYATFSCLDLKQPKQKELPRESVSFFGSELCFTELIHEFCKKESPKPDNRREEIAIWPSACSQFSPSVLLSDGNC